MKLILDLVKSKADGETFAANVLHIALLKLTGLKSARSICKQSKPSAAEEKSQTAKNIHGDSD